MSFKNRLQTAFHSCSEVQSRPTTSRRHAAGLQPAETFEEHIEGCLALSFPRGLSRYRIFSVLIMQEPFYLLVETKRLVQLLIFPL